MLCYETPRWDWLWLGLQLEMGCSLNENGPFLVSLFLLLQLYPVQVPHSYKQNVCQYKDQPRYFYSAMVSSLDHAVDRVRKQNILFHILIFLLQLSL